MTVRADTVITFAVGLGGVGQSSEVAVMCEWGTDVEVENLLTVDGGRRTWKIDACIAQIVKALNDGGVETIASCCGHGEGPSRITLADDRELFLLTSGSDLTWRRRWNGRTEKRRLVTAWEPA